MRSGRGGALQHEFNASVGLDTGLAVMCVGIWKDV